MRLGGGCGRVGFRQVIGLGVGSGESIFHVTRLFPLADVVVVDEAAAMAGVGKEAKVALSVRQTVERKTVVRGASFTR